MFFEYSLSSILAAGTAILGSQYTQQSVQGIWYKCVRPEFAPPNWVFPIVWTLLYIALAIAFGTSMIKDSTGIAMLHVVNLVMNVLWCRSFFGQRQLGPALAIILGNLGIAITIAFTTTQTWVRILLIPYIAWLSFATILNTQAYRKEENCAQVKDM